MTRKENLDRMRRWSTKELSDKISESKKELFTLNQEKVLGKLKNVAQISQKRREVARLATVLDEKIAEELG